MMNTIDIKAKIKELIDRYEEQKNENVDKLLEWILSEEGQYIIEETGYVGVNNYEISNNDRGF